MAWLNKARHTFHYSNCYLYWCMFQMISILALISLFFVDVYNGSSSEYLFTIELGIFLFMVADLAIYFLLFGCSFKFVLVVEMVITLASGVILCFLLFDNFKKIRPMWISIGLFAATCVWEHWTKNKIWQELL